MHQTFTNLTEARQRGLKHCIGYALSIGSAIALLQKPTSPASCNETNPLTRRALLLHMLTSTVAILHDNDGHGEDYYVVRTLNDNLYLDAVMDGVTGRRGWEASQTLADALTVAPLTSPADLLAVLEDINQQLYRRGLGHFLLTTIAAALYCESVLHRRRRRQPCCAYTA